MSQKSNIYNRNKYRESKVISWKEWMALSKLGHTECDGSLNANNIEKLQRLSTAYFIKQMPISISGDLFIKENGLKSLESLPNAIGGDLHCYNKELTMLGASHPIHVSGNLTLYIDSFISSPDVIHMKEINRIGNIIVDGDVRGFNTTEFINNNPDRESLENGIAMLSAAKNAHLLEEGIAMMKESILRLTNESDLPAPSPKMRF